MANAINPLTIATAIAALSVSVTINGTPTTVKIKDLTNFPQNPGSRDMPLMFPKIDFVTDFFPEPQALATGSSRPWNFSYNLNYRVLYAPISQQRTIADMLAPMTDLWAQIVTAIAQSDVGIGSEEFMPGEYYGMGVVNSPNEDSFWGFDMKVAIMEMLA